ncbi:MAG: CYTH domain-containing protein [Bacteroidetes bacterium]|nr:CYTH domain-containing protein [Bacteroidota bacterium]
MATEIERKYLVHKHLLPNLDVYKCDTIIQGYLSTNPELTVRLRIKNDLSYLTFKGPRQGFSRTEIEFPVDLAVAEDLISSFQLALLSKKRYTIPFKEIFVELDVFERRLEGLILAEIEMSSEKQPIELPEWIAEDVSVKEEYYNVNLIKS